MCLLDWPFYNFKSSKPNKSASLFGRKNRRLLVGLLDTLSELSTPPLQWSDLVLAKALVKTPNRSSTSSISPLNKPQELWSITVALAFPLSISIVLTDLRPRFSSSSHQKAIQTAPKGLLKSPILAQAKSQERSSKLNGTARTSGSHRTLFAASLLYKTIVQQWVWHKRNQAKLGWWPGPSPWIFGRILEVSELLWMISRISLPTSSER